MLNLSVVHKYKKAVRRVTRKKHKTPEQRVGEKRFHLDERFHVHRVINNKPRAREKQELRNLVINPEANDD